MSNYDPNDPNLTPAPRPAPRSNVGWFAGAAVAIVAIVAVAYVATRSNEPSPADQQAAATATQSQVSGAQSVRFSGVSRSK